MKNIAISNKSAIFVTVLFSSLGEPRTILRAELGVK